MNKEEIIEGIQFIGMSEREAKVLFAMYNSNKSLPVEIAKEAKIAQSKVYESLKSLEEDWKFIKKKDKNYELIPDVFEIIQEKVNAKYNLLKKNLKRFGDKPAEVENIKSAVKEVLDQLKFHEIEDEEYTLNKPRWSRTESDSEVDIFYKVTGTSPNSGNKVGIFIIPPSNRLESRFFFHSTFQEFNSIFIISKEPINVKDFVYGIEISSCEYNSNIKEKLIQFLKDFDSQWINANAHMEQIGLQEDTIEGSVFKLQDRIYQIQSKVLTATTIDEQEIKDSILESINRVITDFKTLQKNFLIFRSKIENLRVRINEEIKLPNPDIIINLINELNQYNDRFSNINSELTRIDEELTSAIKGKEQIIFELGYKINPFFFITAGSKPENPVNQSEAKEKINFFIKNTLNNKSIINSLLITDEMGMGKSHILRYYTNLINSQKFGKAIASYVKCLPGTDLLDSLQISFLSSSRDIPSIVFDKIKLSIEKSKKFSTISEYIDTLRNLTIELSEIEYNSLFLVIDEFENVLPVQKPKTRGLPRSLIQLKSLLETYHISYIISIRKEIFVQWESEIREIFPSSDHITTLNKFTEKEFELLFNTRLQNKLYHSEKKRDDRKIHFSSRVIKEIEEQSGGNIRKGLELAQNKFRKSLTLSKSEGNIIID